MNEDFLDLLQAFAGAEVRFPDRPDLAVRNTQGLATAKAISFVAVWTIGWFPGFESIVCIADAVIFVL
jgi:hypothetical protein